MAQYLNFDYVVNHLSRTDRAEHMKGCYITEIVYPTSMKKLYEYDRFYMSDVDCHKVILSYETHNGTNYNKKT